MDEIKELEEIEVGEVWVPRYSEGVEFELAEAEKKSLGINEKDNYRLEEIPDTFDGFWSKCKVFKKKPKIRTGTGGNPPKPPYPDNIIKIISDIEKKIEEKNPEEYKRYLRMRKKYTSGLPVVAIISALGAIASGFSCEAAFKTVIEQYNALNYGITETEQVETISYDYYNELDDMGISLQDSYDSEENTDVTEYGDISGNAIKIESEEYQIIGMCIFDKDGNYISSIEDYNHDGYSDQFENGNRIYPTDEEYKITISNVSEYIKFICDEMGLKYDEINVSIHLAQKQQDGSLGLKGWVDITEKLSYTQKRIERKTITEKEGKKYNGIVDHFKGDYIEINGVHIKVTDGNGKLLPVGSKTTDEYGNEYVIDYLEEVTAENETQIEDGKKIRYKLSTPALALALAGITAAIVSGIVAKVKNNQFQENPTIYGFENTVAYEAFLKKFKKNLEEYNRKNRFFKAIRSAICGKTVEVVQNLTEEQVKEIYKIINDKNGVKYVFDPRKDKINFRDGQIYIIFADGHYQNITDDVIPYIAHIGKDNPEIAEGLTDETYHSMGDR